MKVFKKKVKPLGDGLPEFPTVATANPIALRYLAIAPPSWGKTELFMAFPDSLLLACEEGHKLVKGYKIVIDCYDYKDRTKYIDPWTDDDGNKHMSFLQAAKLIEKSDRFKFIIIDTVDALVKMIIDYHIGTKKVEHIEDIGAYGRGYDIGQNSPFRRAMNQIIKTGRGMGYTTHQQVNERLFKTGPKAKKETTLPSGILKILVPQVDIAFHGEFGKKRKGNRFRDRIVVTEGTDEIVAKNRGGIMPNRFILPQEFDKRWPMLEGFFKDKLTINKAEQEHDKIYGSD